MNRKTTETRKDIPAYQALFVNLRLLYVADMRYVKECSGNERVVLSIVLW